MHVSLPSWQTETAHLHHSSSGASAALFRDDILVATVSDCAPAVEDGVFVPATAVGECIAEAGITLLDIDVVAVDAAEEEVDRIAMARALQDSRVRFRGGREWMTAVVGESLGFGERTLLVFCDHVGAHAEASWFAAGCAPILCLCLDGFGAASSGGVFAFGDGLPRALQRFSGEESLDRLLHFANAVLSLRCEPPLSFDDIGIGGDPDKYTSPFTRLIRLRPDGTFQLSPHAEVLEELRRLAANQSFRSLVSPIRSDIAAALRCALFLVVKHVLQSACTCVAADRVCLAGSVLVDPSIRAFVMTLGLFRECFCHPTSDDTGNSIGAAVFALKTRVSAFIPGTLGSLQNDGRPTTIARWSMSTSGDAIRSYEAVDTPDIGAECMANGSSIIYVGNIPTLDQHAITGRDVLIDCRMAVPAWTTHRPMRIFALAEYASEYFENAVPSSSPSEMILRARIREDQCPVLPAITPKTDLLVHTVSEAHDPLLYRLLANLRRFTGFGLVVCVGSRAPRMNHEYCLEEALANLVLGRVDRIFSDSWMISRADGKSAEDIIGKCYLALRPNCRLAQRRARDGRLLNSVDRLRGDGQSHIICRVTPEEAQLLSPRHAKCPLSARASAFHGSNEILERIAYLWDLQLIQLSPSAI